MDWYAPESFSFECKLDEGPSKMIENMQAIGIRYTAIEDKKIGDVVVQLTLQIPSKGVQITYYRGKDRCDAAISAKKTLNNLLRKNTNDERKAVIRNNEGVSLVDFNFLHEIPPKFIVPNIK